MDQSDFRTLLHRYQQGECTPAEKHRIEQWYKHLGSEQEFNFTPDEKTALAALVWQRISAQTGTGRLLSAGALARLKARASQSVWSLAGVRWAAAALLVLGAAWAGIHLHRAAPALATVWPRKTNDLEAAEWRIYANASAFETHIVLPDGSAVALEPASTLKYPRTFRGAQRTVFLTGGAFFDVFHDARHPFLVYTDQVVTTVLGTRFRVQAYAGQAEVQVQVSAGKVRVTPRRVGPVTASLDVLPNQQAVYSPARRQLRRELVAAPVLLAPQAFAFKDRPVAEVLAALSKAYGVEIDYDEAALRACTLTLSLGKEPLFEKLDIICEALGATYEQANGRILFRSQPCQAE